MNVLRKHLFIRNYTISGTLKNTRGSTIKVNVMIVVSVKFQRLHTNIYLPLLFVYIHKNMLK